MITIKYWVVIMMISKKYQGQSRLAAALCSVAALAVTCGSAVAAQNSDAFLPDTAAIAMAPTGFVQFCARMPQACGLASDNHQDVSARQQALQAQQWAQLLSPPALSAPPTLPPDISTPLEPVVDTSLATGDLLSLTSFSFGVPSLDTGPWAYSSGRADRSGNSSGLIGFGANLNGSQLPEPPFDTQIAALIPGGMLTESWTLASDRTGFSGLTGLSPTDLVSVPSWATPTLSDLPAAKQRQAMPAAAPVPGPATVAAPTAEADRVTFRSAAWRTVEQVNDDVNARLRPADDWRAFGEENHWALPFEEGLRPQGNCKHFALEKQHALIAAGVPKEALSVAIVRTEQGQNHAVLLVRTDKGDYVLDNLSPWINPWRETRYTWVERQAWGKALIWADMGSRRAG